MFRSLVRKLSILAGACLFLLYSEGQCRAAESENSEPVLDLEKIIVTPSRLKQYYRNSPVKVDIIEEKEVAESGASDISKVLNALPTVNVVDYGSLGATKTVHVRGVNNSQVITLIDGRPVSTPSDGVADYNQIPLNNIERIEVMKGPASNIYGANAIGGVVNVITKSGKEKMLTELNLKSGSYFTHGLDFANGWKKGNADYFISTNYIESDGYRTNSDYKQENYNLKLGYDVNKENRIVFESGYAESKAGAPGREQNEHPNDRQEQWNDYFGLSWEGSCWKNSNILFKVYRNKDRLEFIQPPVPKTANLTKVYGVAIQLSQMWFNKVRTSIGLDGQENMLNSSASAKHKYNFKAAYGEAELKLFDDLTIKGGARIDDYSNFGNRTSPSASFAWWLFDKIKIHGLVAKSFRAPTFNDLYWPKEDWDALYGPGSGGVEGNPNLKPETAVSREIGVGTSLFGKIEADATYFYNKFNDMIAWTMDDTFWWRPSNVNRAVIKGVEANLDFHMNKALGVNLNYTRLSATNTATHNWIIYRPRHEYKGTISYNFIDKANLYLTGRRLSKRYTTEDNSTFLKGYFVMDANCSYNITKFAQLTLTVNNVLDENYEEEEGYPMPGTSAVAGMKLKF